MHKKIVIFFFILSFYAFANKKGQTIFQENCIACHTMTTKLVGPSIKEMRAIYSKKNIDKMIMWIKTPGKKRKNSPIQMPPMSYLGDKKIQLVAEYILSIPPSLYNKKKDEKIEKINIIRVPFSNTSSPALVERLFIKSVGPASFLIRLNKKKYLCFDPVIGEIRFLYEGDYKIEEPYKTFQAQSDGNKSIQNNYNKTAFQKNKASFLGYQLLANNKVNVRYMLDNIMVNLTPNIENQQLTLNYTVETNKIIYKNIFDKPISLFSKDKTSISNKNKLFTLSNSEGKIKFKVVINKKLL